MGKIEKFEDLEAWQKSRELTKLIYQLSGSGNFGRDFGLKVRSGALPFQIRLILQKGLNEMATKNFYSFCQLRKGHVEKSALSFISH